MAARQQDSEARAGRATHPRKRPAIPMAIVRQELPAAAVRIRRATDVLTNRSRRSAIRRHTTTTAAHRNHVPIIHHRIVRTQRRGHIPHRAAAILLLRAPTPRLAIATAEVVEQAGAAVVAEVPTVEEAPLTAGEVHTAEALLLTRATNLLADL